MINKAIIVGRLGNEPEVRYTQSGKPVCNFSVATSEKWKDASGEYQEKTEWHRIVCFGNVAENCGKYLSKGSLVYLEGKIQTRQWEDNNGNKRYTTEIVSNTIQFLDTKNNKETYGNNNNSYSKNSKPEQQSFDGMEPGAGGYSEGQVPF